MKFRNDLTAEYVRYWLDYEPATGRFTWRVAPIGGCAGARADFKSKATGYRLIPLNGTRTYAAHRIAILHTTGEWPRSIVDHINRQRDDNRIENLRVCTPAENSWNRTSLGKSGLKGVRAIVKNCWSASITVKGIVHPLGRYNRKEDAYAVYCIAEHYFHGEFATEPKVTEAPPKQIYVGIRQNSFYARREAEDPFNAEWPSDLPEPVIAHLKRLFGDSRPL